jgi:ribosomal protein S18 acetylase RimI-like enzyme
VQSELQRDDWLSHALGVDAYVVEKDAASHTASGFYTCRVASDDVAAISALEDEGFHVVDVNVTLERAGGEGLEGAGVAPATPAQHQALLDIAESCFRYSRFHLDPLISDDAANRVKRAWVASYLDGTRGVELLAVENGGRPAGFLAVLEAADGARVIDLVGVAPDAQGAGLGEALVKEFAHRHGEGGRTLRVGTQVANVPSLRLYEKLGFRVTSARAILHRHVGRA